MKLKELVENTPISYRQLAEKTGVSRPTINTVLKGKKVSVLTVKKICAYFGKDWHDYVD